MCVMCEVRWRREGSSKSSSIKSSYPGDRQRRGPRRDMCNLILPFINKKRTYYVDWVSSEEHRLGRCNLMRGKKHSNFTPLIKKTIILNCLCVKPAKFWDFTAV